MVIDGLGATGNEIIVVSRMPSNHKNCKIKILKIPDDSEGNVRFHSLKTFNFPIIKNISNFFQTYRFLKKQIDKNTIIICDTMQNDISYGAVCANRKRGTMLSIVTDIYGKGVSTSAKEKIHTFFFNKLLKKFDGYIFLTKQMNSILNPNDKPYMIMEGLVDYRVCSKDTERKRASKKICLYAGGLNAKFGLKELIDGFKNASIKNSELHIYGSGSYKDEIIRITSESKNIKYYGVVSNDIVLQKEREATLLINPRIPTEDYCNYSFPSKNMEYMSSGTPMIGTKLPGIPKEYFNYMFVFDNISVEHVSEKLKYILSLPDKELQKMGKNARDFVFKNKNNIIQAARIVDFSLEVQRKSKV
jgi:glycosyltransferase involved in cell wall biosynthesis